ncbi:MAG: TetR/AcrR family transcriptional regulator [Myxococcota bacterium]
MGTSVGRTELAAGTATAPFDLEPHGERRRRQLISVAAHLIETEGPDAVRMARVAELAGCTRPLVYRYFPQREDLLVAVVTHFYERLNASMTGDDHARGVAALADPDTDVAWAGARRVFEALWDVVTDVGMGGLVLSRSELVRTHVFVDRSATLSAEIDHRWFEPLRALGLGDVAIELALECATSTTYVLVLQHRAGALSRDEAVRLGFAALHALVAGLLAEARGAVAP